MRIEKLNQTTKKNLLEDLLKRSPNSYEMYEEQVKAILDNVKKRGDEALFEYTEKFDGFCLDQQSVLVKEEEIEILKYLAEEKIQIIHQVIPDETPCVLNKLLLGEKEE